MRQVKHQDSGQSLCCQRERIRPPREKELDLRESLNPKEDENKQEERDEIAEGADSCELGYVSLDSRSVN